MLIKNWAEWGPKPHLYFINLNAIVSILHHIGWDLAVYFFTKKEIYLVKKYANEL